MMPKPIESTSTVMKTKTNALLPAWGELMGSFMRRAILYEAQRVLCAPHRSWPQARRRRGARLPDARVQWSTLAKNSGRQSQV
jgi:hypothetical protein